MANVDSMVLAADPTVTTYLAAYLNAAMSRDASARDAYARIYGAEWSAIGDGTEINDTTSATSATVR